MAVLCSNETTKTIKKRKREHLAKDSKHHMKCLRETKDSVS